MVKENVKIELVIWITLIQIDMKCLRILMTLKLKPLTIFSSVFSQENDCDFSTLPPKQILHTMPSVIFTDNDILERLQRLKITKSPGVDKLHPRILFELRHEIVYIL